MNRSIIYVGVFVAGGGSGFLVARQLLVKKYTDIAESEIDSMREMFERQRRELLNIPDDSSKIVDAWGKDVTIDPDESNFRHLPSVSVRSSIDDNKYEQAKKNYNILAKVEEEPTPDELVEAVIQEVIDQSKPYLIDDVQYAEECDHFAKLSLVYYLDGVLCDENEEMLDDVVHTIGQPAYDLLNNHPVNMWIRNELMSVDYEIIVLHQDYGESSDTPSDEGTMRRRKPYEEQ